MKRRILKMLAIFLLNFTVLSFCQAGQETPLSQPPRLAGKAILVSGHATILTGKSALPLFNPCSRNPPAHITGYWTPAVSDIQQLERDAPTYLKAQKRTTPKMMVKHYRQYAGFIQQGRKMIYVNGFQDPEDRGYPSHGHTQWQSEPVVACDGGPSYYGMEYDIQTRQFYHLEFNGFI